MFSKIMLIFDNWFWLTFLVDVLAPTNRWNIETSICFIILEFEGIQDLKLQYHVNFKIIFNWL